MEAYKQVEDKSSKSIIAHMKENGGCRAWEWKERHITEMLVKLGLEEATTVHKEKRRQLKGAKQKFIQAQRSPPPQYAPDMIEWPGSHGMGLPQLYHQQPHAADRQLSYDDIMSDDAGSIPPGYRPQPGREYLEIVSRRIKGEHEEMALDNLSLEEANFRSTMSAPREDEAAIAREYAAREAAATAARQSAYQAENVARQAMDRLIVEEQGTMAVAIRATN